MPEFWTGLAVTVPVVVVSSVALGWFGPDRRPWSVGGWLTALCTLIAVGVHRDVPVAVVLGTFGLATAAAVATSKRFPTWSRALAVVLAVPFAVIIGFGAGITGVTWIRVLVVAAAWLGSLLAAEYERRWGPESLGPALLALAAVGAYFCVPDTEEAAVLLAAALVVALIGWPLRIMALGRSGAAASVAVFAWIVAVGGAARPASIIGAMTCVALLVAAPVGRRVLGSRRSLVVPSRTLRAVAILVAQGTLMVFASRVIGLRVDASLAAILATATMAVAVVTGALLMPA